MKGLCSGLTLICYYVNSWQAHWYFKSRGLGDLGPWMGWLLGILGYWPLSPCLIASPSPYSDYLNTPQVIRVGCGVTKAAWNLQAMHSQCIHCFPSKYPTASCPIGK